MAQDAKARIDELRKALDMDPSLKQVAHADGDVNDLLLDSKDNH